MKIAIHFEKIYSTPRINEPAYVSVPFAKGQLKNESKLALVQGSLLLPFQARVTARHSDGSVKFLFIRFQVNLPSNKSADLELYIDETPDITEYASCDKDCVYINLSNSSNHLFSDIKAFDRHYNGEIFEGPFLTDINGTAYIPTFEKWNTVESGQVCNIYSCNGVMTPCDNNNSLAVNGIQIETRLTTYTGKPWIDLSFRLINTSKEPLNIKLYTFNIKNESNYTPRTTVASSNYKTSFITSETGETVETEITSTALLNQANEHFAEVMYGTFFADITDKTDGITATVYQAFQNFPKAVRASRDGIEVLLVPQTSEVPVTLQSGMAVEQNIQLYFHKASEDLQSINNRSIIYQMPDRAHLSPLAYKACGFLPDIFPDTKDLDVENALIMGADSHSRAFGMMNWGDAPDPNYTSQGRGQGSLIWTNNEYDFPYACMLMYYRTGIRRFLDYALVAGRHQRDVDICHSTSDLLLLGGQWEHTKGHTLDGKIVCSHEWVEGLFECYHATADERFYEAAVGIGENVLGLLKLPMYRENGGLSARETGWALRTLTALYKETHDKKWIAPSDWIVSQFKEWFERYDGWLSPYTDNIVLRVPFMISIAVGSLMRYYREFPRDDIRVMIIDAVDDMIENCLLETGLFYYKEMPSLSRIAINPLPLEALTIAYELTKDTKYLEAGKYTYKLVTESLASGNGGGKKAIGDAVVVGSCGTKKFAQAFIPVATYYTALCKKK